MEFSVTMINLKKYSEGKNLKTLQNGLKHEKNNKKKLLPNNDPLGAIRPQNKKMKTCWETNNYSPLEGLGEGVCSCIP